MFLEGTTEIHRLPRISKTHRRRVYAAFSLVTIINMGYVSSFNSSYVIESRQEKWKSIKGNKIY